MMACNRMMNDMSMNRQQGETLVSVMIGVAIGIFLMGVAIKIYLDSKASFGTAQAMAATIENGRFALDDMRRYLVMGGFLDVEDSSQCNPFVKIVAGACTTTSLYADGEIIETDADGSAPRSDVITVMYGSQDNCDDDPNDNIPCNVDCFGSEIKADTHEFPYVAQARFEVNETTKELRCRVKQVGGTEDAQPLLRGVENMQVLYGIMEDDIVREARRYIPADVVEAEGLWSRVVSLKIGVVVSSGDFTLPVPSRFEIPGTVIYNDKYPLKVLDTEWTPPTPAAGGLDKTYRVYTSVIVLKNQQQRMAF